MIDREFERKGAAIGVAAGGAEKVSVDTECDEEPEEEENVWEYLDRIQKRYDAMSPEDRTYVLARTMMNFLLSEHEPVPDPDDLPGPNGKNKGYRIFLDWFFFPLYWREKIKALERIMKDDADEGAYFIVSAFFKSEIDVDQFEKHEWERRFFALWYCRPEYRKEKERALDRVCDEEMNAAIGEPIDDDPQISLLAEGLLAAAN